ncbi:hypothetical protein GUJ93_ZPchr0009g1878 [Zizania palustris]|uniref:Uncharacterized protein n=1 Tax=Zizania palustris TaxID=103762 RepID=A0A8J5VJY8_ZIZPA|nr:hypothetical protein GUJ93_ZPchr0009g1878 [Zizania palustris]
MHRTGKSSGAARALASAHPPRPAAALRSLLAGHVAAACGSPGLRRRDARARALHFALTSIAAAAAASSSPFHHR